jgi:hypothetical protein
LPGVFVEGIEMLPDLVIAAAGPAAKGYGSSAEAEAEAAGAIGAGDPGGGNILEGWETLPKLLFCHFPIIPEGL